MAYKSNINPIDMVNEILDKYRKKVAVLKCDVQCRCGTLLQNSIVYIEINEAKILEDKPNIELNILDCCEKKNDTFTVISESNDELADILENLFDVDDKKTECYEQYVLFNRQVKETKSNADTLIFTIKAIFTAIAVAVWLYAIVLFMLAIWEWDIRILTSKSASLLVLVFLGSFIIAAISAAIMGFKFGRKIRDLQKSADNIYAEILEVNVNDNE